MSKSKQPKSLLRREFLKTAGLATGAAGAAAVVLSGPAKAAMPTDSDGKSGGYRETDHVRKYYELSRF